MPLLEITGLQKTFIRPDGSKHRLIDIPSLVIAEKAQVAISGESGLGKTTMLHLIAGILRPDAGSIKLLDREMSHLSEPQRDQVRAELIGYVFQTFNLLPAFTSLENVLLGMTFGRGVDRVFAEELLNRVGLNRHLQHYPHQLSTGQQQRVAVARALANRPKLVLADEPTGNLDPANSHEVLKLIREMCAENGAALLLVSHDRDVLAQFESVLLLSEINKPGARLEVCG